MRSPTSRSDGLTPPPLGVKSHLRELLARLDAVCAGHLLAMLIET
ncbi:MAG: hypothetical protein ACLFVJ_09120 [Persicimonas sp.]